MSNPLMAMHGANGQSSERVLPHSEEAEKGLLCSMCKDPVTVVPKLLAKGVTERWFYLPAHRTFFNEFVMEHREEPDRTDLFSFTQVLRDHDVLDSIGGGAVVTDLFMFVPSAANLARFLDTVREKFLLREIIREDSESVERAYEPTDDVDSVLLERQQRQERIASLFVPRTRLPDLSDLSQMLGDNKPARPSELVTGVLHQGSKLIVGGTSKGRKTYSLLDLAVSVATGHSWWGFDTVKGSVCYINFEIQEAFFCERVQTICEKKGVTLDPMMLMGWNLRGHGEGIERMVTEIMRVLRKRKFVLVIFDPIYKALGDRDENKAGDVASMLNELEKIAVKTGAAIAFGAHYSKGNQSAKESIDRIGGSGVFARDPDSILTMTAHEQPDAFTVEATLRNFKPLESFVVKWDWPLFQRTADLDPTNLKQVPKAGQFTARYNKEMILDELSVLDGIKGIALKRLMDEKHGMSRSKFFDFMRHLRDQKQITEREGLIFKLSKTR